MVKTTNTSLLVGSSSWKQQFKDAVSVQGGGGRKLAMNRTTRAESILEISEDDEADMKPSCLVYVMHALTLPWKLLFALVPPTGVQLNLMKSVIQEGLSFVSFRLPRWLAVLRGEH